MPFELSILTEKEAKIEKIRDEELIVSDKGDSVEGVWMQKSRSGDRAGGSPKYLKAGSNPQFNIRSDVNKKVTITLEYYGEVDNVGVVIYEVQKTGERITNHFLSTDESDDFIAYATDVARKVQEEWEIEAGKDYCVIPFTEYSGVEGRFRLSIPGIKLIPI